METVTQSDVKAKQLLQVTLSADAVRRIKVAAALAGVAPGRVISDLATEHLPAVSNDSESLS